MRGANYRGVNGLERRRLACNAVKQRQPYARRQGFVTADINRIAPNDGTAASLPEDGEARERTGDPGLPAVDAASRRCRRDACVPVRRRSARVRRLRSNGGEFLSSPRLLRSFITSLPGSSENRQTGDGRQPVNHLRKKNVPMITIRIAISQISSGSLPIAILLTLTGSGRG